MTTLDADVAGSWVRRWDAQQERYVADREERFAVIGDVVEQCIGESAGTVVDLGCGPGSLAARLVARLSPDVRVIGVDTDPLLLALGRANYGHAVEFVDADLTGDWQDRIPAVIDAAVSTTALHWLNPDGLAALYRTLARRLRPGGVFVDGDNFGTGDPALDRYASRVRHGRAARAGVTDREEWEAWWAAAGAEPSLADLLNERDDRAIAHHGSNDLAIGVHADMLRAAGFSSAGPVWQSGDDHVLVAIR